MAQRAFLKIRPSKLGRMPINFPYRQLRRRIKPYKRRRLIAATVITPSLRGRASRPREFLCAGAISSGPMGCLFHGDYGLPDPAFNLGSGSTWVVDANSLKEARNLGEAEAIQRHLLRGEGVSWCHQGYAWVDQDAVVWFYFAAFLFVILPYLILRARACAKRGSRPNVHAERLARHLRFPR
jgi:hypothetical protein